LTDQQGMAIQYNTIKQFVSRAVVDYLFESEARAVAGRIKGGYMLRVVRDVRCVLSRRLNVSSVLDSLIVADNSFQMVGAAKLSRVNDFQQMAELQSQTSDT